MYSVVRIFKGGGRHTAEAVEAARTRGETLASTVGLVTLLVIRGDDGALVNVEIFETLDDMTAARDAAAGGASLTPTVDAPGGGTTIAGEIVFQRGL